MFFLVSFSFSLPFDEQHQEDNLTGMNITELPLSASYSAVCAMHVIYYLSQVLFRFLVDIM